MGLHQQGVLHDHDAGDRIDPLRLQSPQHIRQVPDPKLAQRPGFPDRRHSRCVADEARGILHVHHEGIHLGLPGQIHELLQPARGSGCPGIQVDTSNRLGPLEAGTVLSLGE